MTAKTKNTNQEEQNEIVTVSHMSEDLKNSVLIVSTVGYLFIFTMWMILQLTTQYDTQLASLIFNR